jgi:DNA-binding transcriptional ArsR family regulator
MYGRRTYNLREVPMPSEDPTRATMLELLRQLNRSEAQYSDESPDQAKELAELEGTLGAFWAVKGGQVSVRFALGLLLKNQMVRANADREFSWEKGRSVGTRFAITSEGKRFLVDSLDSSDRVK